MNRFVIKLSPFTLSSNVLCDFIRKPSDCIELEIGKDKNIFMWGDPIYEKHLNFPDQNEKIPNFLIENVAGHYYYIIIDNANKQILAGNSLFSILPLYFLLVKDSLYISDSVLELTSFNTENKINKRFILENILFNYPLFNQTCISEINLLPSNSYLFVTKRGHRIIKHTKIEDCFTANPRPWKVSVELLSDMFLQTSAKYFPSEKYLVSLTGGFDGRTLLSTALYHKKKPEAYSFGSNKSDDLIIAKNLSNFADIGFHKIALDEEYIKNSSYENGIEFIKNAEGSASFARAHYLHAVKAVVNTHKYLVTGNFGSELFRAAHVAGVVISKNLYYLFEAKNLDTAILQIKQSPAFSFINKESFKNEWADLIEDLKHIPSYNNAYSCLTLNQKFYVFVFEEIFRKYFGAEMQNQFHYLKNRTPFIDYSFLTELLKTGLAGVHSDFFEHNPIKRFKGQVLYSHIIHKAYPEFGKILTDKGYFPNDLMTNSGKINITLSYLKKKIFKQKHDKDPYSVDASFNRNKQNFLKTHINNELFNNESLIKSFNATIDRDSFFVALSQAWWNNFLSQQF